jgi:nitroreductase/NAD-dependent dihydropyrimidine dehydrogenase PreA subunit
MEEVKKETGQDKAGRIDSLRENYTETEKVILSRRSVRWYKKEQVPEFMVNRILEAGRYAPSAGNCQPWKFVVLRDAKIIDDLTKSVVLICKLFKALLEYRTPGGAWKLPIAKFYTLLMPEKLHPVPFAAISLIADGKLKLYHGAPTTILIFQDKRGVSNPALDCGIAGQNMCLAAHSMGLGTCWVSFSSVAFQYLGFKWNRFFGIKYPYKFLTSLAIGWPMGKPDGMVDRPVHSIPWFENGRQEIRETGAYPEVGISERFSVPHYGDPGQTHWGEITFDQEKCNGCGTCARICPADSIFMDGKKPAMTEGAQCMSCGDCVSICPEQAIGVLSNYRFTRHFKTIDHGKLAPPRME